MPAYMPAVHDALSHGYSPEVVEAFVKTFELAAAGKPGPQSLNEVLAFVEVQRAMGPVFNGRNPSAADALNSIKDQVRAILAGNR